MEQEKKWFPQNLDVIEALRRGICEEAGSDTGIYVSSCRGIGCSKCSLYSVEGFRSAIKQSLEETGELPWK